MDLDTSQNRQGVAKTPGHRLETCLAYLILEHLLIPEVFSRRYQFGADGPG
jgi:hypothetical protein